MRAILSAFKKTILTAPYWVNVIQAFQYFLATRKNNLDRSPFTWFQLKGLVFGIRPIDWYAMESIIMDQEYKSINNLFTQRTPEIIIDAGANVGLFSIYILSIWPAARIFSIEASPETYAVLKKNQDKNSGFAWQSYQYALWGQDGEIFFKNEGESIGWHVSTESTSIRVPALRLDTFINNHLPKDCRISLLKIDIEGAEQSVLEACPDILDIVDTLLIEIHPNLCDIKTVFNVVRNKFPHVYNIAPPDSHFPVLLANRQALSLPAGTFQELGQ